MYLVLRELLLLHHLKQCLLRNLYHLYEFLKSKKIETIIDDTDENISAKIKKFNLIGIPYQLIIGSKSEGNLYEFKEVDGETQKLKVEDIASQIIIAKQN